MVCEEDTPLTCACVQKTFVYFVGADVITLPVSRSLFALLFDSNCEGIPPKRS
jgi:hypothetical protein